MGAIGVFGHSSLAAMGTASELVVHNRLVQKVFTGASSRATNPWMRPKHFNVKHAPGH